MATMTKKDEKLNEVFDVEPNSVEIERSNQKKD